MIAASVGVKKPPRMPPTMITIVVRLGSACHRYLSRSRQGILGLTGYLRFLDMKYTAIDMANAIRNPGINPAANRRGTVVDVNDEYTTNGIEGGITGPIVDDAAVMAAENSSSNPASFMALISMDPRPAASATAAPDMPEKMTDWTAR